MFSLSNITILLVAFLNLVLGFFVLFRNRRNQINTFFGTTIFGIAFWCITIAGFRASQDSSIFLWGQLVYFAINFVVVFFLYFSYVFPFGKLPGSKILRFFLFVPPILLWLLTAIPRSIITSASFDGATVSLTLGWGFYAHSLITVLYFIWAFVNLVRKFKKSTGVAREQIRYLFTGTVISTVLGVITNVILFFFTPDYNWVGPAGTIIMVGFITYAISQYRLMDIRLIILRSITFSAIVVTLSAIFIIVSSLIGRALELFIGATSELVSGLVVGMIFVLSYERIKLGVEKVTSSFLYKKSYDSDELLSDVKNLTSSIIGLNTLLDSISKLLEGSMHPTSNAVVLLDTKGELKVVYQSGFKENQAVQLANGKENDLFYQFKKTNNQIVVIDELISMYEAGEYEPHNKELLYALHQADISLIIPLTVKDKIIGVIALGTKKSGDLYTQQDINVLELIAGQVAIAVENAQLYEELKEFNRTLQKRVDDATQELRAANEQLREMDRMKSDFISIASHQLRTPLTVIKGYISMLQEGSFGKVSKKVVTQLDKVFQANERLIDLVENLLDISRIESGRQEYNFELTQLEDKAVEVVENLKANAAKKGLKLTLHKPKKKLPQVMTDRKLHEVMMNFVDNAIKYTNEGSIDVTLENEPKGMVTFSVKDTGTGVDQETLPHLFRKFSRAKGSFQMHTEGLGLGLFVAKMIADAHGGTIGAESAGKGKGSRFFVSLPTIPPKKLPSEEEREPQLRYLGE